MNNAMSVMFLSSGYWSTRIVIVRRGTVALSRVESKHGIGKEREGGGDRARRPSRPFSHTFKCKATHSRVQFNIEISGENPAEEKSLKFRQWSVTRQGQKRMTGWNCWIASQRLVGKYLADTDTHTIRSGQFVYHGRKQRKKNEPKRKQKNNK